MTEYQQAHTPDLHLQVLVLVNFDECLPFLVGAPVRHGVDGLSREGKGDKDRFGFFELFLVHLIHLVQLFVEPFRNGSQDHAGVDLGGKYERAEADTERSVTSKCQLSSEFEGNHEFPIGVLMTNTLTLTFHEALS